MGGLQKKKKKKMESKENVHRLESNEKPAYWDHDLLEGRFCETQFFAQYKKQTGPKENLGENREDGPPLERGMLGKVRRRR